MADLPGFAGFDTVRYTVDGITLSVRTGGPADAPPILLLHGFPQTHVAWHRVAPLLADRYRLVIPDLRGYGDSDKPAGDDEHLTYSKRAMAADLVGLMRGIGHRSFAVVGHDRGGRVAHRMALDHPDAVTRLAVLDIAPTLDVYVATDKTLATAYYHWFFLIQPSPLPETLIGADPGFFLRRTLAAHSNGTPDYLDPAALAEYLRCFDDPAAIHAQCEDYRAAAGIDLIHDRLSRDRGEKIRCDLLVVWGANLSRLVDPLPLWQAQCSGRVTPLPLTVGHFIPEEAPGALAAALQGFLDTA